MAAGGSVEAGQRNAELGGKIVLPVLTFKTPFGCVRSASYVAGYEALTKLPEGSGEYYTMAQVSPKSVYIAEGKELYELEITSLNEYFHH